MLGAGSPYHSHSHGSPHGHGYPSAHATTAEQYAAYVDSSSTHGQCSQVDTEGMLHQRYAPQPNSYPFPHPSLSKLCAEFEASRHTHEGVVLLEPTSVRHSLHHHHHQHQQHQHHDPNRERHEALNATAATSSDLLQSPQKRSASRSKRSEPRSAPHHPSGPYADVPPRYLEEPRGISPPPVLAEKPSDPFLDRHKRMIAGNGYGNAAPRLYNIDASRKEAKRLKQQELLARRPKDEVLSKHKQMQRKLGLDNVPSRLFHNTYGITSPPDQRAVSRTRSSSRGRKLRAPSPRTGAGAGAGNTVRATSRTASSSAPLRTTAASRSSSAQSATVRGASPSWGAGVATPSSPVKRVVRTSSKKARQQAPLHPPQDVTSAVSTACQHGVWEEEEAVLRGASACEKSGDYVQAERMHLEVLKMRRKNLGCDHAAIVSSLRGLGMLSEVAERWPAGAVFYTEALQQGKRLKGSGKPVQLLRLMQGLGRCLHFLGRNEEAEVVLRELLRDAAEKHGSDHPLMCCGRYWLGEALLENGGKDEADELAKVNEAMGFVIPKPRSPLRISQVAATQTTDMERPAASSQHS